MTDAPWRWSASRMAQAIGDKTASAEEVVSSCLQRTDSVNATLDALVEVSH